MNIRPFQLADEDAVVALWQRCDITRPWNDPHKDIQRKLTVQPEMFLVAVVEGAVIGTVMAGYDGHRGWINYLAVDPEHRRRGIATALLNEAERMLRKLGCPKINLQVRFTNHAALDFYRRVGFSEDQSLSLGKRLVDDAAR